MEIEKIKNGLIFETITGSHSYGTSTPESDMDTRGIVFAPKEYVFGTNKFEQFQGFNGEDKVWYELRFAFSLMADCNPNMIDFLFTDKRNWTFSSLYWEKILENRDLFISKKSKFTYSGYAISQLKRIETHRKWLFNPITEKPNRKDFGLNEFSKKIRPEQRKAILSIEPEFLAEDIREEAIAEMKYEKAKAEFESYENWKKNRNPKRAKLEEKCGYDSKHASHLIRLIRMGKEILSTGKVNVDRTNIDADYLMKIRKCEVPWENILEEVERTDKELDSLYETSTLKHSADREKINELAIELYEKFYFNNERK